MTQPNGGTRQRFKLRVSLVGVDAYDSADATMAYRKMIYLAYSGQRVGEVRKGIEAMFARLYPEDGHREVVLLRDSDMCDVADDFLVSDVFDESPNVYAAMRGLTVECGTPAASRAELARIAGPPPASVRAKRKRYTLTPSRDGPHREDGYVSADRMAWARRRASRLDATPSFRRGMRPESDSPELASFPTNATRTPGRAPCEYAIRTNAAMSSPNMVGSRSDTIFTPLPPQAAAGPMPGAQYPEEPASGTPPLTPADQGDRPAAAEIEAPRVQCASATLGGQASVPAESPVDRVAATCGSKRKASAIDSAVAVDPQEPALLPDSTVAGVPHVAPDGEVPQAKRAAPISAVAQPQVAPATPQAVAEEASSSAQPAKNAEATAELLRLETLAATAAKAHESSSGSDESASGESAAPLATSAEAQTVPSAQKPSDQALAKAGSSTKEESGSSTEESSSGEEESSSGEEESSSGEEESSSGEEESSDGGEKGAAVAPPAKSDKSKPTAAESSSSGEEESSSGEEESSEEESSGEEGSSSEEESSSGEEESTSEDGSSYSDDDDEESDDDESSKKPKDKPAAAPARGIGSASAVRAGKNPAAPQPTAAKGVPAASAVGPKAGSAAAQAQPAEAAGAESSSGSESETSLESDSSLESNDEPDDGGSVQAAPPGPKTPEAKTPARRGRSKEAPAAATPAPAAKQPADAAKAAAPVAGNGNVTPPQSKEMEIMSPGAQSRRRIQLSKPTVATDDTESSDSGADSSTPLRRLTTLPVLASPAATHKTGDLLELAKSRRGGAAKDGAGIMSISQMAVAKPYDELRKRMAKHAALRGTTAVPGAAASTAQAGAKDGGSDSSSSEEDDDSGSDSSDDDILDTKNAGRPGAAAAAVAKRPIRFAGTTQLTASAKARRRRSALLSL